MQLRLLKYLVILLIFVTIVPAVSVYADKDSTKDLCEKNGGDWEGKTCDFADDDEDKADRFGEDHDKLRHFEEERAADEDALCDDPEDSEKFDVYQF